MTNPDSDSTMRTAMESYADSRCQVLHPRRWRPKEPCHECEMEAWRIEAELQQVRRETLNEVVGRLDQICAHSEQISGDPTYASVRTAYLRDHIADWRE